MKITKRQLRRIILSEMRPAFRGGYQHEEPDNSEVKPTPGGYGDSSGSPTSALGDLYTAIDNLIKALGNEEAYLELSGIVEDWDDN